MNSSNKLDDGLVDDGGETVWEGGDQWANNGGKFDKDAAGVGAVKDGGKFDEDAAGVGTVKDGAMKEGPGHETAADTSMIWSEAFLWFPFLLNGTRSSILL